MELVDMLDLGSSAARRGGSTPFSRTKEEASGKSGAFFIERICRSDQFCNFPFL